MLNDENHSQETPKRTQQKMLSNHNKHDSSSSARIFFFFFHFAIKNSSLLPLFHLLQLVHLTHKHVVDCYCCHHQKIFAECLEIKKRSFFLSIHAQFTTLDAFNGMQCFSYCHCLNGISRSALVFSWLSFYQLISTCALFIVREFMRDMREQ